MAKLAISKDYFQAYAGLPRKAQRKADEFLTKFQRDSTALSIHLEPIGSLDPQLRSARIGDDYRVILRAPEKGDVFLVLWADHHDEAYRWAATKQTAIHPATGSLQIFDPVLAGQIARPLVEQATAPQSLREFQVPPRPALFEGRSDDELFLAGVPRPLLPSVRALHFEDELDLLLPHLPPEAAETLTGLYAGLSLDEALEEVFGRPPPRAHAPEAPAPDVLDLPAALERETTQRQFRLLGDDLDLDAALTHPLDVWRVFLHPRQKRIAHARTKGPVRVLGGAGTGKTVVALHRAAFLAREVFKKPDDRILFTTYNTNLAEDIRSQLTKLVGPDELARIEVKNIDAWASQYLKSRGKPARALFEGREQEEHFRGAYEVYGDDAFTRDFYLAEWRDVVQEQGLTSDDEYVRAVRRHRGVPLPRAQRRTLWPVFQAYREALDLAGVMERVDVLRAATRELESAAEPPKYRSVIVDETQDFPLDALRLVRAIAGPERADDLFLVGDAQQRIYGRPVGLSSAGIQVRGRRSQTLRLNYRTTGAICRYATRVLEDLEVDDLDDGKADRRGYVSLREGPQPILHCLLNGRDEERAVVDLVTELLAQGVPSEAICIMARTKGPLADRFGPALERASIPCVLLEQHEPRGAGVRLSTMHRAKGLEFGTVILVDVSEGAVPFSSPELRSDDPMVAHLALVKERSLLYVASSRARDDLYVFASGALSSLLPVVVPAARHVPEVIAHSSRPPAIASDGDILATRLSSLPLPTRMLTWAERAKVMTLAELAARTPSSLASERNLGRTSIANTRKLIEGLTGKTWEELALGQESSASTSEHSTTVEEAVRLQSWDALRVALNDEQRSIPLAEIELPARIVTYCQREALVTLGDLAQRSRVSLDQADNLGRASIKDLPRSIGRHLERGRLDRELVETGLLASFKSVVQDLEPTPRMVVTRRSGLGGEPLTLQELGDILGVSRERARQIEDKACQRMAKRPWGGLVRTAFGTAMATGAVPLRELATEPFWQEAAGEPDVIRFLADAMLECGHVVTRDGEPWLSPLREASLEEREKEISSTVEALDLPCKKSSLHASFERLTADLGPRLQASLWKQLESDLQLDAGPGGEEMVAAIGSTQRDDVLAVLRMSDTPMSLDEVARQVKRLRIPDEVIYFDRGKIGLRQHFPDFDMWKARLVPRAEEIVRTIAPDRQWSCVEILDELREEWDLPPWLGAWCLAALIKSGSALRYLGRIRVALPGNPENEERILVHEEVERLLRTAGEPMTRDELSSRVRQRLGASDFALQQVFSRPLFARIDGQRIGLVERDVPGGPEAVAEAMDHLEGLFQRRGRGMSHHQTHQAIVPLSPEHATWPPELVTSLVRGDGRFRLSLSDSAGLATWESTRVPTRLELAKSALQEAGGRVSVEAVIDRIEAHYGDRPTRGQLATLAMNVGASLDGDWIRTKVSAAEA